MRRLLIGVWIAWLPKDERVNTGGSSRHRTAFFVVSEGRPSDGVVRERDREREIERATHTHTHTHTHREREREREKFERTNRQVDSLDYRHIEDLLFFF